MKNNPVFFMFFWLIIIAIVLLFTQLACGVTASLPTSEPISNAVISYQPTKQPTEAAIPGDYVKTLGQVNIRLCPSTSCEVIGVADEGMVLEVGAEIRNDVVDCPRWYPVMWEGRGAFVCAEWMSK